LGAGAHRSTDGLPDNRMPTDRPHLAMRECFLHYITHRIRGRKRTSSVYPLQYPLTEIRWQ
jgi:hypothetical protein